MPRYRGNLNNTKNGQFIDLVGETMTTTLETFSGDIVCEAFSLDDGTGAVDHIRVTVRGHKFESGVKRAEVVLYNGPIHQLHDATKRDLFIKKIAEDKLKQEFGT